MPSSGFGLTSSAMDPANQSSGRAYLYYRPTNTMTSSMSVNHTATGFPMSLEVLGLRTSTARVPALLLLFVSFL